MNLSKSNTNSNVFKLTGKVIKHKITVLGEYKIIKLTNFKIRKKKYETKVLKQKMKENRLALSKKDSKLSSEVENQNFKMRHKLFQRMQTNVNQSLVPMSQGMQEHSAFLRENSNSAISNEQ
jgi:hypothetical protein